MRFTGVPQCWDAGFFVLAWIVGLTIEWSGPHNGQ